VQELDNISQVQYKPNIFSIHPVDCRLWNLLLNCFRVLKIGMGSKSCYTNAWKRNTMRMAPYTEKPHPSQEFPELERVEA